MEKLKGDVAKFFWVVLRSEGQGTWLPVESVAPDAFNGSVSFDLLSRHERGAFTVESPLHQSFDLCFAYTGPDPINKIPL